MSEIHTLNMERNFEVIVCPCLITKRFDRCIQVKLGTVIVSLDNEDDEAKAIEVFGAFSREGLDILKRDLEAVPDPIELPSQAQVNADTAYQWAVVMEDGEHYQQYPIDGGEMPFSKIVLPEVMQFWIMPRESANALPWYGLVRGKGWFIREQDGTSHLLELPYPQNEAFEWHYYRHNYLTFQMGAGSECETLPPHIIQCLGWRIGETVFEIGVEFDGNYQVWKRHPLDDPRFQ